MNQIPTQIDNPTGLHQRYYIQKVVVEHTEFMGSPHDEKLVLKPVDPNAEYFVLRLDHFGSDPKHIEACRVGVNAYADAIKGHLPELSKDLKERYPVNRPDPVSIRMDTNNSIVDMLQAEMEVSMPVDGEMINELIGALKESIKAMNRDCNFMWAIDNAEKVLRKVEKQLASVEAEDFEAEAKTKYPKDMMSQQEPTYKLLQKAHIEARQMSLNQHKAPVTCVEDYPKPLVEFLLNTYALQVTEAEAFKILHDTASVPDITVQHKAEGASHKIEIYEQALNTILYMKKDPGETDSKYAFNRCWHAANDALTAGAVITTQPAPIDPLKAREIAEKAMNHINLVSILHNSSREQYQKYVAQYLDTHYPLPSDTEK